MRGLGTLINTVTVLGGGVLGLVIGNRIPDRIRAIIVQVIGLTTLVIGLRDVIDTENIVFPLVGMILGGILGELLRIEDRLASVGESLRRRFAKQSSESSFVNGFVTA
ncbi:MAG: DUF554 family protein, partial [Acidimicrobiia bacterium]|nr:DUF554 family protein [Acidimicrobiia bacterium]